MQDDGADSTNDADSDSSVPTLTKILSVVSGRKSRGKKWASKMKSKKMTNSGLLAEQHGIRDSSFM